MDKKLINIVKGDINTAILNGSYNRNTAYQTNIEFNTPTKLILLDGVPYSNPSLTKVTWQELKDLRDNNRLIAGSLYRITDYQCTTTQENTQSAGHQFDIVLLALSNDKLAEEGWAMEHPTDVYDVTFDDGVTKKCYLNFDIPLSDGSPVVNIVDVETLQGIRNVNIENLNIDREAKTAITENFDSTELATEGLQYNYFQNSNLSAWKVWYCLDNDKSRFAWADNVNGKGVIYRLIDEFNNDIKYDFKNIQFKRKLTNGQYDATNGTDTWCYTLNIWYNNMCQDASIVGNTLPNDEGYITGVYDNVFGHATAYNLYIDGVNTFAFTLGNNVVLSCDDSYGFYYGIYNNTIRDGFYSNTIGNMFTSNTIGNDFYKNTIGSYFYFNMIGNNFHNKTISDNTSFKNYGSNGVELATKDDLS